MKRRREFLKTAGAFAAGSLITPFGCTSEKVSKDIGLQIYTLRNEIQKDGLEVCMEKVAATGYKWIEAFGYQDRKFLGKSPKEFAKIITDLGMSLPSVHAVSGIPKTLSKEEALDQMKITAEDTAATGAKYLVWAYLQPEDRTSMEDYKRHIEQWNIFGAVCKDAGIQFAYHNHDFEFQDLDGLKPYDVILKETDHGLVQFELDLYWITKSGNDPVAYFQNNPGRFPLWHVKDMYAKDDQFAPVGKGKIDFKKIFEARKTSGMKYFFVEQDSTREGASPFATIKTSWNYLNNADFILP